MPVLFFVALDTFPMTHWDSSGSFDMSPIVLNFKDSAFIFQRYFSIEFTSLIIHFTSSGLLFSKFSVDNAQSVMWLIHLSEAASTIFTTLSAQALCHAKAGSILERAHLLFPSIIIARCCNIFSLLNYTTSFSSSERSSHFIYSLISVFLCSS